MRYINVSVILFAVLLTGCGSSEGLRDLSRKSRSVRYLVNDVERTIDEVGDAVGEVRETGQQIRGLRSKQFTLELAKSSALTDVRVRVRPVGTNQYQTIEAGSFARYGLDVSRFVNSTNFTIDTELNGVSHPVKVRREFRRDQQDGPAELLVLTVLDGGRLRWMPPSRRDDDETIEFDGY